MHHPDEVQQELTDIVREVQDMMRAKSEGDLLDAFDEEDEEDSIDSAGSG